VTLRTLCSSIGKLQECEVYSTFNHLGDKRISSNTNTFSDLIAWFTTLMEGGTRDSRREAKSHD
jgi:hypothetical protein